MLKVNSKELYALLGQCAVLRGQEKFDEAINLVEPELKNMEPEAHTMALLQLLYAAHEGGQANKALHFAQELEKIDPEIPSVKKVLDSFRVSYGANFIRPSMRP